RARQFSARTEDAYVAWIRRYVIFHQRRHPADLNGRDVAAFLTDLANRHGVSPATQRQAASALMFLYADVLRIEVDVPAAVLRPSQRRRLPIVLTRSEVRLVLAEMSGQPRLGASLLYGAGMRLMESLELRIKDISLERREIAIRSGKGGDDRVAILPAALKSDIERQIDRARRRHDADVGRGGGWVAIPRALARKMPGAARDFAWQYLFASSRCTLDQETGQLRRNHLHETAVQRAVTNAVRRS